MSETAQLYKYNDDSFTLIKESVSYFAEHFRPLEETEFTEWLNIHSLEDTAGISKICQSLGIDKLVQEDIFTGTKRPRLEEYPDYIFFSIESALPTPETEYDLIKERMSFIMGDDYLISFQSHSAGHFPNVRDRIEKKRGKIRFKGPDFLLYRLLEAIIDNYMEVVDEVGEKILGLDKAVLRHHTSDLLRKVEWEKRKLVDLRKTVIPMRDLLMQIDRVENSLIVEDNCYYFEELKGTCSTLLDEIDAHKQMLDGVANLYYATQGQKMNEIMKVLTVTSAVFIPLTFIVGVYGMNFDVMPELKWKYGYLSVWILMITITAVLIFIFWKRGWLKRNDK